MPLDPQARNFLDQLAANPNLDPYSALFNNNSS